MSTKIDYPFLMPGDPDDPITRVVQAIIDNASPTLRKRLKRLEAAILRELGRRKQIREEIENDRHERDDLLGKIAHADRQLRHGVARSDATDADTVRWYAMVERLRAAMAEKEALLLKGPNMPFASIIEALRNTRGPFAEVEPPRIPEGKTALQMFDLTNQLIADAEIEKQRISKSSSPLDEIKKNAREDIMKRAEAGKPNTGPMFRTEITALRGRETTGRLKWPLDYEAGAMISRPTIDAAGLVFWLHSDAIIERVFADIELKFDPANAMTTAERARAMADIDAKVLDLHYEACGYAALAEQEGIEMTYRYGCPPLAIIGLRPVAAA